VKVINGNIIQINEGIVCHVVNNKGVMGAGVAKALYTKYPEVRSKYLSLQKYELGTCQPVRITDHLVIVNMIAQDGYGRDKRLYLQYDALSLCLNKVRDHYNGTIYVPFLIGCGLAGGDWAVVSKILDTIPDLVVVRLGG
jgi:O-acetyl-ADP-ribose deacetylase (regulator of RNase III)